MAQSSKLDLKEAEGIYAKVRALVRKNMAERYESRLVNLVDSVSVTSDEEAARFKATYGRTPEKIIPSAVHVSTQRPEYTPSGDRVLWLGALDYSPNVAGLRRFIAQGLPRLNREGLVLRVVGTGGDEALTRTLRAHTGIEFLGYVDDLTAVVPGTRAAVVPLWSGAGVKLKTLTLMDLGLPVVATPVAMEGIPTEAALEVSIEPRCIADAIIGASIRDLQSARSRALRALERGFSDASFKEKVEQLAHAALSSPPEWGR